MEIRGNAGCHCGSGREVAVCCGGRAPGAPTLSLVGASGAPPPVPRPPSPLLATADGRPAEASRRPADPEPQRLDLDEALRGLHRALQEPEGDVGTALARLSPCVQPPDAEALGAIEAVLYHGHGQELIAWIPTVLPPAAEATPELEVVHDGLTLREVGCELVLDRLAAAHDEPGASDPINPLRLLRALRPLTDLPVAALTVLVGLRRCLPPEALGRASYRYDLPGQELVPNLVALTTRFCHLLAGHWGWPPSRALLATREILALLLARADPGFDLDGMHACRACVLALPARTDLARGATAVVVDPNVIILTWAQRLALPGGPFRSAGLLEALPRWVQFLEALRLVDRTPALRMAATAVRLGPILAPSLADEARRRGDRAIAAAARRLALGPQRAS